ncbi:MAG: hypothetical protein WCQ67_07745 [Treponema sp.]
MSTTSNIYTLLKFYASRQKTPMIDFNEFADYLKRYSQHHMEDNPDLACYIGNTDEKLQEELDKLKESNQIVLVSQSASKQLIFVLAYFIDKYASRYKEIESNTTIPFPIITEIEKNVPAEIVTKKSVTDIIYHLLETKEINDKTLYGLVFTKDIPTMLFPSSVSVNTLIEIALTKTRDMLRKDEYHDYFLKKLSISNPGKEMTSKTFFNHFIQKPEDELQKLKDSGDNFYFWSQLSYFIKQDYDKLKDFTAEDINVLQSVYITEAATSFYKSQAMKKLQKENAFNTLSVFMKHPPYYFTYSEISKMKDSNGISLVGQYTADELKNHLQKLLSQSEGTNLPEVLTFKTDNEAYLIYKEKIMPLIVRLCSDARITVRDNISKVWTQTIKEFDTVPEMKDQNAFELCLQRETQATQPILYSLLNTSFLPLLSYDDEQDENTNRLTLFKEGTLIPYSEILMMSRQEILTDIKIKLPFWYTMPFISWIASLILRKPKSKRKKEHSKTAAEKIREEELAKVKEEEKKRKYELENPTQSKKQELREAAENVENAIVPKNSTLDRELFAYCREWNNLIGKQTSANLTEDVNSLIRDYMRKVLRTLKSTGFTPERIKSLAESLVESPSLQKIKNHEALEMYTELYMVKLVKNLP